MQNTFCNMTEDDAWLFVDTKSSIGAIYKMEWKIADQLVVKNEQIKKARIDDANKLYEWFKARGVTRLDAVVSFGNSTVPRVLSNEIDYKGIGLDWLRVWKRFLYWLGL